MYEEAFYVGGNEWVNIIVKNQTQQPSSHALGNNQTSYDTNFTLNGNITWDVAAYDATNTPASNGGGVSNGNIYGLIYQLAS